MSSTNVLKFRRKRKPRKEAALEDIIEKVADDVLTCKLQVDSISEILRQNIKHLNKILKKRGKEYGRRNRSVTKFI